MKRYKLKYLLSTMVFSFLSVVGFCQSATPQLGSVKVTVPTILSFDIQYPNIDFRYDVFGTKDKIYEDNTFFVTGNVDWEFSIRSGAENFTPPTGSTDEIPVSNIKISQNGLNGVDNGVEFTVTPIYHLSTEPQVLLAGYGSIPETGIRLDWEFTEMDKLGNIRAGFYTVPVIYQITITDIP